MEFTFRIKLGAPLILSSLTLLCVWFKPEKMTKIYITHHRNFREDIYVNIILLTT